MEMTAEQMIDAAEVLKALHKQISKELPYGTTLATTKDMDSLYRAERLLRDRAGRA